MTARRKPLPRATVEVSEVTLADLHRVMVDLTELALQRKARRLERDGGLQKGDRVTVEIPPRRKYSGRIVGEGRDGHWWMILKDGNQYSQGIAKSFCRPENAAAAIEMARAAE